MNQQDTAILQATPLFAGFQAAEMRQLLQSLRPTRRAYQKGETLLLAGYATDEIAIVLEGQAEAIKETRAGGRFTMSRMGPGGVFGDVLAGSHVRSPVSVYAVTACRVVCIPFTRLLSAPHKSAEPLHRKLLANLVAVIADKYFMLDERIDLLLTGSLRKKITAYLLREAQRQGTDAFVIPYTREGLASYLGCERSALSRELSRMAADGLLVTHRARFTLLRPDALRLL